MRGLESGELCCTKTQTLLASGFGTIMILASLAVHSTATWDHASQHPLYMENMNVTSPQPMRFVLMMTKGKISARERTPMLAIESLCKMHPSSTIEILSWTRNVKVDGKTVHRLNNYGCAIQIRRVDMLNYTEGTPLHKWLNENYDTLKSGSYWHSHATDIMRYATLWKEGGWYLDTDVIVVKPLNHLQNVVGLQSSPKNIGDSINGALMHFRKGHPVLKLAMMTVPKVYNATRWMVIGPTLLNYIIRQWTYTGCQQDYCVNILPTTAFYPIPWYQPELFFRGVSNEQSLFMSSEASNFGTTYAFHFWNAKTSAHKIIAGSLLGNLCRSYCLLCDACP